MTSTAETSLTSFRRMLAAEPVLTRIAPLSAIFPNLPANTLFHAGPPFNSTKALPAPILNAAAAAAVQEKLAADIDAAAKAIRDGDIHLRPAQDFGIVTPLAFVAGPGMFAVAVEDRADPGAVIASPLNDGPPAGCLRFGVMNEPGRILLASLNSEIGPELSRKFAAPVDILPLLANALANGDELHGQVAAANAALLPYFGTDLSPAAQSYFQQAGQFVLNVIMAACALMLRAGDGIPGSAMVTACGGNGQEIGYQCADAPGRWITLAAAKPVGPKMPGKEAFDALPAIGDSAVIDALGFGAACLRFAPALFDPIRTAIPAAYADEGAHDPFIGPHPSLPLPGLKLGLDLNRPRQCLGIMLGMVEETGTEGLLGRGVAPWPDS